MEKAKNINIYIFDQHAKVILKILKFFLSF